jgi:hypothetical protein
MRAIAAIHVASNTPIAMTTIVLNFTSPLPAAPEKNIAVGPLIPGRGTVIETKFTPFGCAL